MTSRWPIATVFLLSLSAASVRAQQPPPPLDGYNRIFQDSLLAQLSGAWTMSGAVHGKPVTYTLQADWILNHQFLRLEMRDGAEPPGYQAQVFIGYDNASERYVAHWLDAGGGRYSETLGFGVTSGSSVKFDFEYPDGPFHTTFTFDAKSKGWTVLMQDKGPDGAWREFAHYTIGRS